MIDRHRFVLLGVSATCLAAHNVLMVVTDWAGVPLWGTIAISFTVATLIGYPRAFRHDLWSYP